MVDNGKKQNYVEIAKKIVTGNLGIDERDSLEDNLVELAYQIAGEYEYNPEEFDELCSNNRLKNGALVKDNTLTEKLNKKIKDFLDAAEKDKVVEDLGDILEIVETYNL